MEGKTKEQEFNEMMDRQREMQNDALFKGQNQGGNTPQNSKVDHNEQRVLNELKAQVSSAPPTPAAPTQGQCPECNLFHPPLPPGKKCPNAPIEAEGISQADVTGIVIKVKDILASQLEQKGVKNFKKFTGGLIIELMKYCEEYKE